MPANLPLAHPFDERITLNTLTSAVTFAQHIACVRQSCRHCSVSAGTEEADVSDEWCHDRGNAIASLRDRAAVRPGFGPEGTFASIPSATCKTHHGDGPWAD
jgi:hypothetical protein